MTARSIRPRSPSCATLRRSYRFQRPCGRAAWRSPRPGPIRRDRSPTSASPCHAGRASVEIIDSAGRRVRTLEDREFTAGDFVLRWDLGDHAGQRVRPGVYFATIRSPEGRDVRRLTVLE